MALMEALDRSLGPLTRALDQRMQRHAAISANVANADTPGYRAVDVSFSGELKRAGLALQRTNAAHLGGAKASSAQPAVFYSGGTLRRDGNDVDIDREMSHLARNQIEYQFLSRTLSGRFRKLREAITGSPA